ncbi:neuron navigator 2-like isoform X2 [Oppia nitens]|nr:neuron navigator 2-like isoform X2 [Oppia nitens]XP_054160659.1 neuron navigator 2-like isoform X2 [Oppia nitens]XP_054160660.1 neuron navigator 2-like isoform X2 [Oppia nitens]
MSCQISGQCWPSPPVPSNKMIPQISQSSGPPISAIPAKGIRPPRPSFASSIPQKSVPNVSAKTSVVLRNKTSAANQSQQTIVDKIKQYRSKVNQQIVTNVSQPDNGSSSVVTINRSDTTVSKRTSSSSGCSSAKSDSSASLCGLEGTTGVTIGTNSCRAKTSVTQSLCKTKVNTLSLIDSINNGLNANQFSYNNNNNNNINSNNVLKKSNETLTICDNIGKTGRSSAPTASIPVMQRRIQRPSSRPTSSILDTSSSLAKTMTSSYQSTSNTSLPCLAKPTPQVKAVSKMSVCEETVGTNRKFDGQCSGHEPSHSMNNNQSTSSHNNKLKTTFNKVSQQQSYHSKPEPTIAMVSPIMAREQNRRHSKNDNLDDNRTAKLINKSNDTIDSTGNLKKHYIKRTEDKNKVKVNINENQLNGQHLQQESPENAIQDLSHEEESAGSSDIEADLVNIKPMAPLMRTSQLAILRTNSPKPTNTNSYNRYPNNYSTIEIGYMSDCTQVNNKSRMTRPNSYRTCYSSVGSNNGYITETDSYTVLNRNKLLSTKTDYMSPTHRPYNDTDRSLINQMNNKTTQEMRRLRRELDLSHDKIATYTQQLATNAHMVSAFEQSLSSMTQRLQQMSASAELKDNELIRLRATIEKLRKHGFVDSCDAKHLSTKVKTTLIRQHTFSYTNDNKDSYSQMSRQLSTESLSSMSSVVDGLLSPLKSKKKPKTAKTMTTPTSGWLRSSFSKAFKKNKSLTKRDTLSDADIGIEGDYNSVPNSPLICSHPFQSDGSSNSNELDSDDIQVLKSALREKDMIVTDLRLESLSSAHQLESLKQTVKQMRAEMLALKQDNDRLNRLVTSKSLASSLSSMTSAICVQSSTNGSLPLNHQKKSFDDNIANSLESLEMDVNNGSKIVTINSGTHTISSMMVTFKTTWDQLDLMIKNAFKEHITRIDSNCGLGLTIDVLACYQLGAERLQRNIDNKLQSLKKFNPEILPFEYIVNDNRIYLQFKSANDSLVFDTLTPKSFINQYIGLLNDHKCIILYGTNRTGKTHLAYKLAEYLAIRRAAETRSPGTTIKCCPEGSIATFSVDHKSAKKLRAYLSSVAEQCESDALSIHLPTVIVLDDLHYVSIAEVFNGSLNITHTKCPYIIGTMNQTTLSSNDLQINNNFQWVLYDNHSEPVKGFLGRHLKRKLIETEVKLTSNNMIIDSDLNNVIEWISKLWIHLNEFIEKHASPDNTIGPRIFFSCPMDINGSQIWFTDLWNSSIIPYLIAAIRDGIQMYGKRNAFVDPTDWIIETYPWISAIDWVKHLRRLRAIDVNIEGTQLNNCNEKLNNLNTNSNDALSNMLMKLQEAANYSNSSQQNQSINKNNNNNNNDITSLMGT